jgi:hypothetical protein
MTQSDIYKSAAKLVAKSESADGGYSCHAIKDAGGSEEMVDAYSNMFRTHAIMDNGGMYPNAWMLSDNATDEETRGRRILALCFMAAITGRHR